MRVGGTIGVEGVRVSGGVTIVAGSCGSWAIELSGESVGWDWRNNSQAMHISSATPAAAALPTHSYTGRGEDAEGLL